MTKPLPEREPLLDIFSAPSLAWIVKRLVARMASGRPLHGMLVKDKASAEERRALDDLLGRRSTSGNNLSLDSAALEDSLRSAGLISTLEDIVLACHGPVKNQRTESERLRASWQAVFETARERSAGHPELTSWVDSLAGDGTLKRLSRNDLATAENLLERAWRAITWSDHAKSEEILLANLAAQCSGDSHALDQGQPLATLCLRAILAMHGVDGQRNAEARREAWAALGVIIDDLSAPVLVFNLHATEGSALEELLELYRRQGQPAFLTYRQLSSAAFLERLSPAMRTVYICENPSIVSAAARELGRRCHPLICTNGQPVSSVRLILARLQEAGVQLRCHADFDWAGLRIVDQLLRNYAAIPWRMDEENYREAPGAMPLAPQSFISAWQPELADAIRAAEKAVFEEQVVHSLLLDLQQDD